MVLVATDLTAVARIRNSALELFANNGVAATSIRDVAKDAGVSGGLVQYHFPSKAALRAEVNSYVVAIANDHFADLPETGSPFSIQQEVGDRVTSFVREHPTVLRYVARSAADGDEGAMQIFDAFVAIAHAQWDRVAESGLLKDEADVTWTALHGVVIPLATVLFQRAIERHLPEPFFAPAQLDRWNAATNALFREGMYRSDQPTGGGEQ